MGESLVKKQRPLIGIIISEAENYFIAGLLENMQKEFFAADMDVAIFSTVIAGGEKGSLDAENAVFDLINYDMLDGVVVFPNLLCGDEAREKVVAELRRHELPTVFVEDYSDEFCSFAFDHDSCADILVEHLSQCHHVKRVVYVSGPQGSNYHNIVLSAFKRSMDKFGIELCEDDIYYGSDWIADFSSIAKGIVESGLPDAVVCCSDLSAAEILGELTKLGVKVPADTIVTGYGKNEPLETDYLNFCTVLRNPRVLAVNSARYIISKIRKNDFVPDTTSSVGSFCAGATCGCAEIDYAALSRSAVDNMVYCRREGFESYYNFMPEDLVGAGDFESFLWKLKWHCLYLGDYEGFWLCLNDGILHNANTPTGYTDKILMPLRNYHGSATVDLERSFERTAMLPVLTNKRERPSAFIFTPLHFGESNFGYIVTSYGSSGKVYDRTYAKWLRYVSCALEKQRRHTIYEDEVIDGQIRDTLTGLMNVRGFKRTLAERFDKRGDKHGYLRVISIDIVNLSGINSAYGYSEGDAVLQRLAFILNNSVSDDDICVRVSSDEFFIAGILENEDSIDEVPMALERNLTAYNSSSDKGYGIHIYTAKVIDLFDKLELLDTIPYEAAYQRTLKKDNQQKIIKRSKNPIDETYDPEERRYVAKLLNENLFTYNFQPIVSAKTGEIYAYEALMRSGNERRISPVAILSHAEALGRLGDVERYTMSNLLAFRHENSALFQGKRLFINSIPSYILPDKDFDELYAHYSDIMSEVTIEFTEQTEATEELLNSILERRKRMGFQIAIDDYGTGYSNISNLLTFMPNCVKIDRSLIQNIHEDKRKQHFTKNIIDYGHDNNFLVLAEGVELSEEMKTVIDMGVDLIQGYYTARPSEKVVQSIDSDVVKEIVNLNFIKGHHRIKKVFFTGSENESTLTALDFEGYTEIFVNSPEYTIKGRDNYISDITIRIKDGIDCKLTLDNVALRNELTFDTIILGKGSKLTLNIVASAKIIGAIRVPEDSDLHLVGTGTLLFPIATNQPYCIGADSRHSYGNIFIDLQSRLYMKVGSEDCVAIGGGMNAGNSIIDIRCHELDMELTGRHLACIGCTNDPAFVRVSDTNIKAKLQCSFGYVIGSKYNFANVEIENSRLDVEVHGDTISGVYVSNADNSTISITDSKIAEVLKGKIVRGVGSDSSNADIALRNCNLLIQCEGMDVLALGNASGSGSLVVEKCGGCITCLAEKRAAIPVDISHVHMIDNEIEINV